MSEVPPVSAPKRWRILYMDLGEENYVFHAEADSDLLDICQRLESGEITEQAARVELAPYAAAGYINISDLESDDGFVCPFNLEDTDFWFATRMFWNDLLDLHIAGISEGGGVLGDWWVEAHGKSTLDEIQRRLAEKYEIVEGQW